MLAVRIRPLAALSLLLAAAGAPAPAAAQSGSRLLDQLAAPPPPSDGRPGDDAEPAADADLGIVPPPPPDGAPPAAGGAYPRATGVLDTLSLGTPSLDLPGHVATRLRALDGDLTALSARSGNHVVDGVLSIVAGGASIAVGIALREDELVAPLLYVVGSAAIARGVLNIALMPNAREPAVEFNHMPMRDRREVEARLVFGENALEHLADRHRLVRLLDAGLNIAVGAAILPLWLGPNDFALNDPGDYFVLITAGISLLSGIVTLVTPTDAERRWDAYAKLRGRLLEESGEDPGDQAAADRAIARAHRSRTQGPRLLAGPTRGGGVAGLTWQF